MDALLAKPLMSQMGSMVRDPLEEARTSFVEWRQLCEEVAGGSDMDATLLPDNKTVATVLAQARKDMSLANNMLAALSRRG